MSEEKTKYQREWLIKARVLKLLKPDDAARKLRISPTLLFWLENDRDAITHPNIAQRIVEFYGLGVAEFNQMVAKERRRAEFDAAPRKRGRPRKVAGE